MNSVLTQELVRFNALVDTVCSTLKNLLLALKGSVLMSSDLDDVANSLRSRSRDEFAPLGSVIVCAFAFVFTFC